MFRNRRLNPQEKGAAGSNWTKIPSGFKVPCDASVLDFEAGSRDLASRGIAYA